MKNEHEGVGAFGWIVTILGTGRSFGSMLRWMAAGLALSLLFMQLAIGCNH